MEEAPSEHPCAHVTARETAQRGFPGAQAAGVRVAPGRDVEGYLNGGSYRVGRPEWPEEPGLSPTSALPQGCCCPAEVHGLHPGDDHRRCQRWGVDRLPPRDRTQKSVDSYGHDTPV